jgi:hypothetical protein
MMRDSKNVPLFFRLNYGILCRGWVCAEEESEVEKAVDCSPSTNHLLAGSRPRKMTKMRGPCWLTHLLSKLKLGVQRPAVSNWKVLRHSSEHVSDVEWD